jgi:hypothetical protein
MKFITNIFLILSLSLLCESFAEVQKNCDNQLDRKSLLEQMIDRAEANNFEIPNRNDELSLYNWVHKTSKKPESSWPEHSGVRKVLKKYQENILLKSKTKEELIKRVEAGNFEIPSRKTEYLLYAWITKYAVRPESDWPEHDGLKALIRKYNETKTSVRDPEQELIDRIESGNSEIPYKKDGVHLYSWVNRTSQRPENEWPKHEGLRDLLRRYLEKKAIGSGIEQEMIKRVESGDYSIPSREAEPRLYSWVLREAEKPENDWPENEELRSLLHKFNDNKLEMTNPKIELTRRVQTGNFDIPSSVTEYSLYRWVFMNSRKPESAWPKHEGLRKLLKKHKELKEQKVQKLVENKKNSKPEIDPETFKRVQSKSLNEMILRVEKGNFKIPNPKKESTLYAWVLKTSKRPESVWPEHEGVRTVLRAFKERILDKNK